MKTRFVLLMCVLSVICGAAHADYTHGYRKRNGTYVTGYHHTRADNIKINNYSTKGNINPYTGKKGYKSPSWF